MSEQSSLPEDLTLFFAGGQGKSGTTWVQLLLDAHPRISCSGEAHFFDLLAPAMHNAFAQYRQQLHANNRLFSELPGFPLPQQSQALAALRSAVSAALLEQLRGQSVLAAGERTPANVEQLGLIWELFPQARFIHVIRDPRDIAVSFWHHGMRVQGDAFTRQYASIDQLAVELCSAWAKSMKQCSVLGRERPGQYLEVRYEDLLNDGTLAMTRMLEFLSLPPDPKVIADCMAATSFEKLSGGRVRGQENKTSHFRKGISGDWRTVLSPHSAAQVVASARSQLERLGYSEN